MQLVAVNFLALKCDVIGEEEEEKKICENWWKNIHSK